MLKKIYLALSIGVLMFYFLAGFFGWEVGTAKREVIPADVRQAPGGYRSFHFWHSGYRGGK
ncbi:MAG: hypothetical protein JNN15_14735 [Blastocatellia bacterium]|nr:hypothetical protein [Blastocatellia bacterium]